VTIRVGVIPYLNCEPFFAHLAGFPTLALPPRQLGEALERGEADTAPLSLADFLRLESVLEGLPYGIATNGPAMSVFLFSDRGPAELDGAVVGISTETSTSVEILRILLAQRYRVTPRAWTTPGPACDAILLIGDAAIRELTAPRRFSYAVDVGSEWTEWTGLPCVFARWGIRRALPATERAAFAEALEAALARGLDDLPAIAARRRDTGWSEAEVIRYLSTFTYRLGPAEERAIAEFQRRRAALPPFPLR
jgi:chorismate dehydratase